MGSKLASLLGIDENDPKVTSGRAVANELASLVESLVAARRDRGLTQQDVAEEMETTQSAISDFERIGGDPKFSTIARYAHAIGGRVHTRFVIDGHVDHPILSQTPDYTATKSLAVKPRIVPNSDLLRVAAQ